MPYEKEFAGSTGLKILLKDQKLKELLKISQFIKSDTEFNRIDGHVVEAQKMNTDKVRRAFVIDGSKMEVPFIEGSLASLSLFNINQCVVDLKNVQEYLKTSFPHPSLFEKIKEHLNVLFFTPLKGMETEEYNEAEFFRFVVYEHIKQIQNPIVDWLKQNDYQITYEESVLDTFIHLVKNGYNKVRNIPCPCPVCRKSGRGIEVKQFYDRDTQELFEQVECKCSFDSKPLFITDLLGFHALLTNENGYEALTTQIMLIMEKLILINTLRIFHKNNLKDLINESVFIVDGTLGFFSHASWLTNPVLSEIADIKKESDLLLFSIEKSGQFLNHFKTVNENYNIKYNNFLDYGYAENKFEDPTLKNGMLFFLDEEYIKGYIKNFDEAGGFYGENNYFGKKVFYKNKNGGLFVLNLAFEDENDKSMYDGRNTQERREQVKRIKDMSMILDNFASQEFANAISLLSMANEGAAISSSYMSKGIVRDFVSSLLSENNTEQVKEVKKKEKLNHQENESSDLFGNGFTEGFEDLGDTSFFN